ncbi:MAG TPA: hypothetical protein VF903_09370 [Nitrospirota bacterium]
MRVALLGIFTLVFFHLLCSGSFAGQSASVVVEDILITPPTVSPGQRPDITAAIRSASNKLAEVAVIAAVTRPDHVVKSWHWMKTVVAPGEKKAIPLPKEYDTKIAGVYKVEFLIYSADMGRRIAGLSRTFTVAGAIRPLEPRPAATKPASPKEMESTQAQERTYFGIGAFGNALNPAGGATIMLWPFRNVGFQGIYTVGVFTSYEGRLLVKLESQSGFNPYVGAGLLHVSIKKKVLDIDTDFADSKVSGVAGVEMLFGKRVRGYVEVSGTGIKLEKDVTSGMQTAHATVKYIPVTIGLGLVWSVF